MKIDQDGSVTSGGGVGGGEGGDGDAFAASISAWISGVNFPSTSWSPSMEWMVLWILGLGIGGIGLLGGVASSSSVANNCCGMGVSGVLSSSSVARRCCGIGSVGEALAFLVACAGGDGVASSSEVSGRSKSSGSQAGVGGLS